MQKAKKLHRSPDTVSRYVREHEAAVNAVRVVMDAQNTWNEEREHERK